jgi:hypothetical protein
MSTTYKIVRMYRDGHPSVTLERGLTLEEAQAHCRDPQTSSSTATGDEADRHTALWGPWFDGYEEAR